MLSEDFLCTKCFQLVNGTGVHKYKRDITLGYHGGVKKNAYLYFPLCQITSLAKIHHAELILYRKKKVLYPGGLAQYKITPTSEYFNPYLPFAENVLLGEYGTNVCWEKGNSPVLSLDITKITANWIQLKIPNKGMMLERVGDREDIVYAGIDNPMTAPFIHVIYSLTGELPPAYLEPTASLKTNIKIKGIEK